MIGRMQEEVVEKCGVGVLPTLKLRREVAKMDWVEDKRSENKDQDL